MKTWLIFVGGGLGFGTVSLGIGYCLEAPHVLLQGGTAFGLSFVPAAAALAWVLFSYRSSPEMQLMASLGSSGLRMVIALGGGFLLTQAQPQNYAEPFWYWLVLFYLTLLAFEITLVVWQQPKLDGPPKA